MCTLFIASQKPADTNSLHNEYASCGSHIGDTVYGLCIEATYLLIHVVLP